MQPYEMVQFWYLFSFLTDASFLERVHEPPEVLLYLTLLFGRISRLRIRANYRKVLTWPLGREEPPQSFEMSDWIMPKDQYMKETG